MDSGSRIRCGYDESLFAVVGGRHCYALMASKRWILAFAVVVLVDSLLDSN